MSKEIEGFDVAMLFVIAASIVMHLITEEAADVLLVLVLALVFLLIPMWLMERFDND